MPVSGAEAQGLYTRSTTQWVGFLLFVGQLEMLSALDLANGSLIEKICHRLHRHAIIQLRLATCKQTKTTSTELTPLETFEKKKIRE